MFCVGSTVPLSLAGLGICVCPFVSCFLCLPQTLSTCACLFQHPTSASLALLYCVYLSVSGFLSLPERLRHSVCFFWSRTIRVCLAGQVILVSFFFLGLSVSALTCLVILCLPQGLEHSLWKPLCLESDTRGHERKGTRGSRMPCSSVCSPCGSFAFFHKLIWF